MPEKTTEIPEGIMRECEEALDAMGGWQEHHDLGAITEAAAPILTAPLREELEEAKAKYHEAQKEADHRIPVEDYEDEREERQARVPCVQEIEKRGERVGEREMRSDRELLEEAREDIAHRLVLAREIQESAERGSIAEAIADGKRVAFEEALATLQDSQVDGEGEKPERKIAGDDPRSRLLEEIGKKRQGVVSGTGWTGDLIGSLQDPDHAKADLAERRMIHGVAVVPLADVEAAIDTVLLAPTHPEPTEGGERS